jgi:tetratricopeptide (TPR) repeat protein
MITRIYTPLIPALSASTTQNTASVETTSVALADGDTLSNTIEVSNTNDNNLDTTATLEAGSFVLLEEDPISFRNKRLARSQQPNSQQESFNNTQQEASQQPQPTQKITTTSISRPAVPFTLPVTLQNNTTTVPTSTEPVIQLQTVLQQENNQTINAHAVLSDFLQTTDMMNPPPLVKTAVLDYLRVAERELRQPEPNIPLVKQLLLATASPLDTHVSQSLGESTTVVREWASTLLDQKINWQLPANTPAIIPTGFTPINENTLAEGFFGGGAANTIPTTKQQLQQLSSSINRAIKTNDWQLTQLQSTEAINLITQAVENTTLPSKQTGKFNTLHAVFSRINAQALTENGEPKMAVKILQTTLRRLEESTDFPQAPKQKQLTYQQLSHILTKQQQWEAAFKAAKQSVNLTEQHQLLPVMLHIQQQQAAGTLALQANKPQEALGLFQQAYQQLTTVAGGATAVLQHPTLPPLANTIGTTYLQQAEANKAELWFKTATKAAKLQQNPTAYETGLKNLSKTYVESNQLDKTAQVLTLLKWFNNNR